MELVSDVMKHLSQSTWLVSGSLIVLSIAVLACALLPGPRQLVVRRFVASVGLAVDERVDHAVDVAQGRRGVGVAIGGVIGTVLATWFVYSVGADRAGPAPLFLIGAYAVAGSVGRAVASAAGEAKKLGGTDRVAHVRSRILSDYIPSWERGAARIMVGSSIVTLSFGLVLQWVATDAAGQAFSETFSVAATVTFLAIVALIGFEVGARLILRIRQSQESELSLAWDDLLRSSAVRDLATAAYLLGSFGFFFAVQEILMAINPVNPPFIASAAGFNLVGTFVVITAALEPLLRRPRQHILRRRYPDLVTVGAQ